MAWKKGQSGNPSGRPKVDQTIQELARLLAGQELPYWAGVKGLAWKDNGQPVVNPERPFIQDLDRFRPRWDLRSEERRVGKECRL